MMRSFLSQAARLTSILVYLELFVFTIPAQAWVLDKSCKPYESVVETAVGHAFDLAATSLYTLHNKNSGDPNLVVARQTLISYIFSWLSSDADTGTKVPGTYETVMGFGDPDKKLTSEYDFDKPAKSAPKGWGKVETPPADYKTLSTHNFIVYCDDSRIIRDKDDEGNDITTPRGVRQYYDKTLDIVDTIDDGWEQCWNGKLIGGRSTSAFALGNPGRPGSLQLCPWYIKKFSTASKTAWDRGVFGNLAKVIDLVDDRSRLHQTKMDNIAGLASTILHELTHLAGTVDLDVKGGDGEKLECYAWQPCVTIGQRKDAYKNADSYAMFANGANLIESTPHQMPMKDGDIEAIAAGPAPKKRDVADSWRIAVPLPVDTTLRKVPSDNGKGKSSGASSTSGAAAVRTTIPFTNNAGQTTSIVYSSQDVKGPDGKPTPRWACVGDLCDAKCKVPSVCKVGDGDFPGGLGWHVRSGWAPQFTGTAASGPPPTGGPQPQPTPAPKHPNQGIRPTTGKSSASTTSKHKTPSSTSGSSTKAKSSAPKTTSKPAVAPVGVFTTIPFTNNAGHSTSIIYRSQDVKGSDGKPSPDWECLGNLCDPKCRIPSRCKDDEGDFPGGLGWHVCCDWIPHIGGGSGGQPPHGGPPPPPKGNPDGDGDDKPKSDDSDDKKSKSKDNKSTDKTTTSKPSSTGCSVTATSTCFETDVVSKVSVKGRSTWAWTTIATKTCKPTVACSVSYKDETILTTISHSAKYVTASHWIDTPPNINVEGQQSMLDKIAANNNGKVLTWTPPGSKSSTSKTSAKTSSKITVKPSSKTTAKPSSKTSAKPSSKTSAKPSSKTSDKPKPPPTHTPPPFTGGICNAHIRETADKKNVAAFVNVTDGAGKMIDIRYSSSKFKYGDTITVPKDKLKYDVTAEFLDKTLNARDRPMIGPNPLVYEAYVINLAAGDKKWSCYDTKETTKGKYPYCNLGDWDTHESWDPEKVFDDLVSGIFGGKKGLPTRDMDCKWEC